jgi:hypothetical protein
MKSSFVAFALYAAMGFMLYPLLQEQHYLEYTCAWVLLVCVDLRAYSSGADFGYLQGYVDGIEECRKELRILRENLVNKLGQGAESGR